MHGYIVPCWHYNTNHRFPPVTFFTGDHRWIFPEKIKLSFLAINDNKVNFFPQFFKFCYNCYSKFNFRSISEKWRMLHVHAGDWLSFPLNPNVILSYPQLRQIARWTLCFLEISYIYYVQDHSYYPSKSVSFSEPTFS